MIRRPEEIRPNIIPYGNCLPGTPTAEAFTRIEAGDTSTNLVEVARSACLSCPQLENCESQRTEIATEFWRQGTGVPFLVDNLTDGSIITAPQERPLQPATLKFDISEVPYNSGQQLAVIRQAVRADQLTLAGVNSIGVKEVAAEYLASISMSERQKLAHHLNGSQALVQAVGRIVRLKFQQLDFGNRQPSDRARSYYDPTTFDLEAHQTIISAFMQDVVYLRELKLRHPDKRAALFDPKFYRDLRARYVNAELTPALFDNVVSANPRNPAAALDTYKVNLHRLRAEAADLGIRVIETTLRKAARLGHSLEAVRDKKMGEDIELPEYVTPGAIRTLNGRHPDNPEGAVFRFVTGVEEVRQTYESQGVPLSDITQIVLTNPKSYEQVLDRYTKSRGALDKAYGQHPDMSEGYRRRLARAYPNPMPEAQAYLSRLAKLRQEAEGSLREPVLRTGAQNGIESLDELKRGQYIGRVRGKFKQRTIRKEQLVSVDKWIIEKITALYPRWEWDSATEGVFELVNDQLVTTGVADFDMLPTELQAFEKVCYDRQKNHLTFAPRAFSLSPLNRMAIAQVFHLAPLIYGQELSPVVLETALGVDDLGAHVAKIVHARKNMQPGKKAQLLGLTSLHRDLVEYQQFTAHSNAVQGIAGTKPVAVTVIGGELVQMTDGAYDAPKVLPDWLEKNLRDLYSPTEQGKARVCVKQALRAGILSIVESTDRVAFGPALADPDLSDKERAIAVHAYGVDRILFRKDLGNILGSRLTALDVAIAIRRVINPSVKLLARRQAVSTTPKTAKAPQVQSPNFGTSTGKRQRVKATNMEDVDTSWRSEALCLRADPQVFDPPETLTPQEAQVEMEIAKAICKKCTVIDACLDEALDTQNEQGVWGGMTPQERKSELARRRRAATYAKQLAAQQIE